MTRSTLVLVAILCIQSLLPPRFPGLFAASPAVPSAGSLPAGQEPPPATTPGAGEQARRGAASEAESAPPPPILPLTAAWTVATGLSPSAPPAFDATRIFLPADAGTVTAFDIASGAVIWTANASTRVSPAADMGRVIVAGTDGMLRAFHADDGALLWEQALPSPAIRRPTAVSGWIVLALEDGTLEARRGDTGETMWSMTLDGVVSAAPAVEGERLYVGVRGRGLLAINLLQGRQLWTAKLDGHVTAVTAVAGYVFTGTTAPWFYSLDPRNGRVRWRWRIGGTVLDALVDPGAEQVIAVMLDQSMRSFRIGNGAQVWREPLTYRPYAGPVRAGHSVLVVGVGPSLHVYSLADGTRQGSYQLPPDPEGVAALDALASGPHFHDVDGFIDDRVVLVTQRGTLHAARRRLLPPVTPLTVLPGLPLPLPSPPPAAPAPADPPPAPPGPPS
ncbi:MAG TPA: PQQ-binding-like beta-propeller repeat protein [Vicinamibacterales bacterium]